MKFKQWLEALGWDSLGEPQGTDKLQIPVAEEMPPLQPGMVRLYRGTKIGELPHANSFFSDERGLEGIAKAFAKIPGRQLVYVDVPEEVARASLLSGAVTDGEYQIPEKYRKLIRAVKWSG